VLEIVTLGSRRYLGHVYAVRFGTCCTRFRKKFTKGTATPARKIEGVNKRLAEAESDYRERHNEREAQT
jgi:hypothetical protein